MKTLKQIVKGSKFTIRIDKIGRMIIEIIFKYLIIYFWQI